MRKSLVIKFEKSPYWLLFQIFGGKFLKYGKIRNANPSITFYEFSMRLVIRTISFIEIFYSMNIFWLTLSISSKMQFRLIISKKCIFVLLNNILVWDQRIEKMIFQAALSDWDPHETWDLNSHFYLHYFYCLSIRICFAIWFFYYYIYKFLNFVRAWNFVKINICIFPANLLTFWPRKKRK